MHFINSPIKDVFYYLSLEHKLPLQPTFPISKLEFYSPQEKATIAGDIGYITIRGNYPTSLEKQLAKLINSKINYEQEPDYQKLKNEFDKVIIATGDPQITKNLKQWQKTDVSVKIIGATIKGNFEVTTVKMWLNQNFAPQGYAYLLPFEEKLASIALATPYDIVDWKELWQKFLNQLNFNFEVKDTFQIDKYEIGKSKTQAFDNTYLVGNAGGFIMPFLGFGQFSAIESSLLAVEAITQNKDYNQLTKRLRRDYQASYKLRKIIGAMSNQHYDKLVKSLNNKLVKQLFLQRKINLTKLIAWLSTPFASRLN